MAGDDDRQTPALDERTPPPQQTQLPPLYLPPPPPPAASLAPLSPCRAPLLAPRPVPAPDTDLDLALRRLEVFLALLGFCFSLHPLELLFSSSCFLLLGVVIPALSIFISRCTGECEVYQISRFEIFVLVSEASVSAVSLICVSHNLRKYGLKRFLFVDRDRGQLEKLRRAYVEKIRGFFSLLFWWVLPCFLVKSAKEIIKFMYIWQSSLWRAVVLLLASIMSWIYLTVVFLCSCILFNLVCNLQVVHFEDFIKLLERETDLFRFLEDHIHLRNYLSKISHRFRAFLLLVFFFVSTSQTITLIETTWFKGTINFINAGDLAVSAVVQVVGTVLCLNAASKISHRVQSIASVASKWHAWITCSSSDSSHFRGPANNGNLDPSPAGPLVFNFSECDLESLDGASMHTNFHLATNVSSYHKRQALVTYLQTNPGGITIYGYTVDRGLINTLFFVELSLVLFVFGNTIFF